MNIIHAIAQSSREPLVLILAGGSHIDHIIPFLERMEYEILLKMSSSVSPTLKKVFNSHSASVSDIHPQPFNMKILDTFIP